MLNWIYIKSKLKSDGNAGFIRYLKNTSWLLLEKLLRLSVGLFIVVWVAKYLGPEQFGLFSYAQSFVGLFAILANLGIDNIVVRELLKDNYNHEDLIGTSFWMKLFGAFLVLFILAIAVLFTSNDKTTNFLIFIVASPVIINSFHVVDLFFQSKVMGKFVTYANIIALFFSSIVKIILLLSEAPLIAFAYVMIFDSLVLSAGLVYFYLKNNKKFKVTNLKFNPTIAAFLLRSSWPLILSGVVGSISMKVDQVMIKEMLGNTDVGIYSAAVRLSEIWYLIPVVLSASLFPAIVNAKEACQKLYHDRLQKYYDLMVWLAVLIALPTTYLSDWVIGMLYGKEYAEAAAVLTIHIWTGVFVFLGTAFNSYLVSENLVRKAFYRVALGTILNIILNIILIPIYGIIGAAIASLFGHIVANYLYDIFDNDLHGQFVMKTKSLIPIHWYIANIKKER